MNQPTAHSILLCTPVRGGLAPGHAQSVEALRAWCTAEGIPFDVRRIAEAPVDAARDLLAAAFLAATHGDGLPFTRCLMVDAGVGFELETAQKLIAANVDFAAAAVPLRTTRTDRVAERGEERFAADFAVALDSDATARGTVRIIDKNGASFMCVEAIGAALICFSRDVLTRMFGAYPELQHKDGFRYFAPTLLNDRGRSYIHMLREGLLAMRDGPHSRLFVDQLLAYNPNDYDACGEDVSFCKRWRALHTPESPAEIWMLANAPLLHEGHGYFRGNIADHFG